MLRLLVKQCTSVQVNYAAFKEHEVKAFWEWLQASGKKVLAYAIKGAVPGKDTAVDHTMTIGQYHWYVTAFSSLHVPRIPADLSEETGKLTRYSTPA